MLTMVFLVVPGGFAIVVWSSYRKARLRAARGDSFRPAVAERWEAAETADGP